MKLANELTKGIIDECIYVHKALGQGLFDTVYKEILFQRLLKKGLFVQRQVPVFAFYEDVQTEIGFKADFIVENTVICDIKSVNTLPPVHHKQMRTYLRVANKRLGLLINFNEPFIGDGIIKVINNQYKQLC